MAKKSDVSTARPQSHEHVFQLWAWVLLFWSLYRYFLKLPEWADELIFKPLIFVGPVLWYVLRKEKRSISTLGLDSKNIFTNIYIGLAFGFIFALEGIAVNMMKYGKININPIAAISEFGLVPLLILSLATAFSEEILSRGFVFKRLYEKSQNFPFALLVGTLLFVLLHVPILVTSLKLQGVTLILFFVTDIVLGLANSLLFYTTGTLVAPILVHIFWNMTVALYL